MKKIIYNPLAVRYSAYLNRTLVNIQIDRDLYSFFKQTDFDAMNPKEAEALPTLSQLVPPNTVCSYSGTLDQVSAATIQRNIPFPLVEPTYFLDAPKSNFLYCVVQDGVLKRMLELVNITSASSQASSDPTSSSPSKPKKKKGL